MSKSRWASAEYLSGYKDDVNHAIAFSGLDMDMFARGRIADMVDLLRLHSDVAPEAASCLDIGCGLAVSHPLQFKSLGRLTGVDISASAIDTARANNPGIEYRHQAGAQLPFEDASFDFSSTVCVMHHVLPDQWSSFVAEAWRVTRPGGLFAIYEHNPINPLTRWAVWRCPFDHDAVLLRMRHTRKLLIEQGFEIVTMRYLFFLPVDRAWARRLERLLRWFPLGAQYVICARRLAI
jgi:SAM-dependent methyltransferase